MNIDVQPRGAVERIHIVCVIRRLPASFPRRWCFDSEAFRDAPNRPQAVPLFGLQTVREHRIDNHSEAKLQHPAGSVNENR